MKTEELLEKIIQKNDLTQKEAEGLLTSVLKGDLCPEAVAGILVGLVMKGESSEEITGFIKAMRSNMLPVTLTGEAIDVCGTGGDKSGSFNISTAVAFVVAGSGVKVAKHGNRSASSMCGSADVLEELGVNLQIDQTMADALLQKVGFVFLFAPLYHPLLKNLAKIRSELKVRTVFNYLGPFLNPALVKKQLIGMPSKEAAELLSIVASGMGFENLLVVSSQDGMDEISTGAKSDIFEVTGTKVSHCVFDPSRMGFASFKKDAFMGGTKSQNAAILTQILSGKNGPMRDIVLLNSAFALYAAGKVASIQEGMSISEDAIDNGRAINVLHRYIKETQKYA